MITPLSIEQTTTNTLYSIQIWLSFHLLARTNNNKHILISNKQGSIYLTLSKLKYQLNYQLFCGHLPVQTWLLTLLSTPPPLVAMLSFPSCCMLTYNPSLTTNLTTDLTSFITLDNLLARKYPKSTRTNKNPNSMLLFHSSYVWSLCLGIEFMLKSENPVVGLWRLDC